MNQMETLLKRINVKGIDTPPGRVFSYLNQPEKNTLPHSCTLYVYDNDFYQLISFCCRALKGGAGVKVILNHYKDITPFTTGSWKFYINKEHPDFPKVSKYTEHFTPELPTNPDMVITVSDSLSEIIDEGIPITNSWERFIELYLISSVDNPVIVDLSRLRPAGVTNSVGLVSTGPLGYTLKDEDRSDLSFVSIYIAIENYLNKGNCLSFLQVLGVLNNTIRRGGVYKNGIITSSMCDDNPYIRDYLNAPIIEILGSHKKGVSLQASTFNTLGDETGDTLLNLIIKKVNTESLFLDKVINIENSFAHSPTLYQDVKSWLKESNSSEPTESEILKEVNRLKYFYPNVCMGIFLAHRDTCEIWRINLGLCNTEEDILEGFSNMARNLTELHFLWRDNTNNKDKNIYLPTSLSKQIGMDVMGLANILRLWKVKYKEFVELLEKVVVTNRRLNWDSIEMSDLDCNKDNLFKLVRGLCKGYVLSTEVSDTVCKELGTLPLNRLHTVEPSQSHSFTCKDTKGFTVCRNIMPPVMRRVRRVSDTQNNSNIYNYGNVETITEVGFDLYFRLCCAWQEMMRIYGRPHCVSYDLIVDCTAENLVQWFNSKQWTKYYSIIEDLKQVDYLEKSAVPKSEKVINVIKEGECPVCAE